jgi:hypothetical protein
MPTLKENREFITVTPKSGEAIKINIDASDDDTKKFFSFLIGYKEQGAKEPESEFEISMAENSPEAKKARREKEYQ